MASRAGLGPVFAYEWLIVTRRWQLYAWRAAFVGLILLGLVFVWNNQTRRGILNTIAQQAEVGRAYYRILVLNELVMVLLAAPAATAGAICLDKARGTLVHVLVTDLSDTEIVLGKLAARLVPVLGLVASSLPVLALGTLLGGVDPVALTGSFLVIVGVALLGCTLALALSVWGRKTHEVLLMTYVVWLVWALALPGWEVLSDTLSFVVNAPEFLIKTNVFVLSGVAHVFPLPNGPGLVEQALFLGVALLLSAALLALTVARMRPVIIGQWGRSERSRAPAPDSGRSRQGLSSVGPTLDGNPVLWREWHRRRPSRWARIVWGIYIALAVVFSAIACALGYRGPGGPADSAAVINGIQVAVGLLLLSVTSATSLSEERARGSLDVLLATPLPTSAVVWGKWWGSYRLVPLLAILPLLIAAALAIKSGRWLGLPLVAGLVLAYGAAFNSLGLALATWIPRGGRALALSVGAVVVLTAAIPVAIVLSPPFVDDTSRFLTMHSPFWGVGILSAVIGHAAPPHFWPLVAYWALIWIIAYAVAAGALLLATLATFDRSLGRLSDRTSLVRIPGWAECRREPAPVVLEEI
jgi:ABC-type transport system involved in multi-copper enzyme maturation permease subunit